MSLRTAALALAWTCLLPRAQAYESPPRALPDYDGRGGEAPTTGDMLLWVPRIALLPLYLVSEFALRRPIGALIAGAERAGLPAALYDFFLFGPDHQAGIVPIGFVDFGFQPSLGLYAFWNDAFARGHDLQLRATTGGTDWLAAAFGERIELSGDGDAATLELSGLRRPDYAYFGTGPRTRQDELMRYGADFLEARAGGEMRLPGAGALAARVILKRASFHRGDFGDDVVLDDAIADEDAAAPPRYRSGYTAAITSLRGTFDTRPRELTRGSGVRAELETWLGFDVRNGDSWIAYAARAGAFLDLNDRGRVLSLSLAARFVDGFDGAAVPFTELATLGGDQPLRAFYPGRLLDRSAVSADLAYRWPIWIWLDGAIHLECGNVFGAHLENFTPGALRVSGSIGVESRGSNDSALQILFGLGSAPFDEGAELEAVRFILGAVHGF